MHPLPTIELGQMVEMSKYFYMDSNKLCSDVPTQVQALSSSVSSGWQVSTGSGLLGSPCTWPAIPTVLPSDISALSYDGLSLTGKIPTQLGLYTRLTSLELSSNSLTGSVPTEIGSLIDMAWGFELRSNTLTGIGVMCMMPRQWLTG